MIYDLARVERQHQAITGDQCVEVQQMIQGVNYEH